MYEGTRMQGVAIFAICVYFTISPDHLLALLRVDILNACACFVAPVTAATTLPRKIAMSMGLFEVSRVYTFTFTFTKDRSRKSTA